MAQRDTGSKKSRYGNPFDRREQRRFSAQYKNSTERLAANPKAPRKVIPEFLKGMGK